MSLLAKRESEVERLKTQLKSVRKVKWVVGKWGRYWENEEMRRRDQSKSPGNQKKIGNCLAKLLESATSRHKENLRNAFGLWYHIVVEEIEFLSAESDSSDSKRASNTDLEASLHRFTVARLGPFYGDRGVNVKVLGDVDEIEEMEEGDVRMEDIKKVYVKEHQKLVDECAKAHVELMKACAVRLMVGKMKQMTLRTQRDSLDNLKVTMLQGIISGKRQAVNTYEMDGDEVHSLADPTNNLRVARGTLGPFRPTLGGRLSVSPLNAVLMERFYSKNGTNMANLVTSPQLVQSFLSYAKGLEGNAERTRYRAAKVMYRLSHKAVQKSLFAGFVSILDSGFEERKVEIEGKTVEVCIVPKEKCEEMSDIEETEEGKPQVPGIAEYSTVSQGKGSVGGKEIIHGPSLLAGRNVSVPKAPQLELPLDSKIPVAPSLSIPGMTNSIPKALTLSVPVAPTLSTIPVAPVLSIPVLGSLSTASVIPQAQVLPTSTPLAPALNLPQAPKLPTAPALSIPTAPSLGIVSNPVPTAPSLSLPGMAVTNAPIPVAPTLSTIPVAPGLSIPALGSLPTATTPLAPALNIPQAPKLPTTPGLSIPAAPSLSLPGMTVTNSIPKAPTLGIPVAPTLTVPSAPTLSIPLAPSLGALSPVIPQAPVLPISTPLAPALNLPQAPKLPTAPALSIPIPPSLGTLSNAVPMAPSLSIPGSSVPNGIPKAPTLGIPVAPTLAVPSAPTLSIPIAPSLGALSASAIPHAPVLPTSTPLAPSLNLPQAPTLPTAPVLSIPTAPSLGTLSSTLPQTQPNAPVLSIPMAPSLSNSQALPCAPSLSLPGTVSSIPQAPKPGLPLSPSIPLLSPLVTGVAQSQALQPKPLPPIPSDLVTKKFHWEPLPKYKLNKTIWLQPSDDIEVDYNAILSLFAEKAKPKVEIKQEIKPVVMILDQKKVNNVGILQSTYPFSAHQTVNLINNLDKSILKIDILNKLITMAPNAEVISTQELEKLQLSPIPIENLLPPERFLKELWVNSSFIQLRIESFRYKVTFESEFPEISLKLHQIGDCFRTFLQSTSFQNMIKTVLRIGNFLNSNTNKGNVAGISLDSLRQLEGFLSVDKRTSLLEFIVKTEMERSRTALGFVSEFEVCDQAEKADLSDVDLKLKDLETGLSKVKDGLKRLEAESNPDISLYKEYMISFALGAGIQIEDIRRLYAKVRTDQVAVAEMYAENKDGKSSDLIRKFHDFAVSCKKIREKMSIENGKKEQAKREQMKTEVRPSYRPSVRQQPRLSVRRRKEGLVRL